MKIRIHGNSIRYRLTRSEVKTLSETGVLTAETRFGSGTTPVFIYALEAAEGLTQLQATFDGGRITLLMPAAAAANWYDEERVGFENQVEVAPGVSLHLLLEKDFACLDNTGEDQSDNYANPKGICD